VTNTDVSESMENLESLGEMFVSAFPTLSFRDQRLALSLYALLMEARPVSLSYLSSHTNLSLAYVEETLGVWPEVFYDSDNKITGFLGLTINKTNHRFKVDNLIVYTWCAWDSLFIPELLNATAIITSQCPTTGELIKLKVSPKEIESIFPDRTIISFLAPSQNALKENVTRNFCRYVNFFSSQAAGQAWNKSHPGSFLLSLQDAFDIGKKVNIARYPKMLIDNKGTDYEN